MPFTPGAESDLSRILAGMRPSLDPELYAFCRLGADAMPPGLDPLGVFREDECITVILPRRMADREGLAVNFLARRITLMVRSSLEAVGLLARVAEALAQASIACNVVSAINHDHLFVPEQDGPAALTILRTLERDAQGASVPPVMYTVAVEVDAAIALEWFEWMRAVHVPEVLATGCFGECILSRVIDPAPPAGRASFTLEYRAVSAGRLREYQDRHAPRLQRAHRERYAGRVEASRSVRQVFGAISPGNV
jgi:hypothetical protein